MPIFGESKYVGCGGSQPCRATFGIRKKIHPTLIEEDFWDPIVDFILIMESLFLKFVDIEMIQMIKEARRLINYSIINRNHESLKRRDGEVFEAFAFKRNLHLPAHVDRDFTYSLVTVHMDCTKYHEKDSVVVYFCFPCLGVAFPLKLGDLIIFSPQEPHFILSRSHEEDEVLYISLYLKSAIVGLNNNSIPNSTDETTILNNEKKSIKN